MEDEFEKGLSGWLGGEPEPEHPLVEGLRQGKDGKWYLPDPHRPGKYLQVQEA